MPGYVSIIIDKSTLQCLTRGEAEWLHHHFMVVIPPVFFSEVLGDVGKGPSKKTATGTGIGDAKMLVGKIQSHSVYLNAEAMSVVQMELQRRIPPPDGRPVLNADVRRLPDGGLGGFVDSTPMQEVLSRWEAGDFDGMEQAYAKLWRDQIEETDLEGIVRNSSNLRVNSVDSLAKLARMVDRLINSANQNFANLNLWLDVLGVPKRIRRLVAENWKLNGRPPAIEYLPYTNYMARLKLFFVAGVAHQLIGTRKSNTIDVEYLEYLPFCKVFSSGDKLHADLFPYFCRPYQVFVHATDLKAALAEMVVYYRNLPEDVKSTGTYSYADCPPLDMENSITRAYDAVWPQWRDWAVRPPDPPMSKEDEQELLARLKANMAVFDQGRSRR